MASRHADRTRYDDRNGGGRYTAPRRDRDDRRDNRDRYDRRRPDDRYENERDANNRRRDRDTYRRHSRSRSPRRDRDRSRDRPQYRDDRRYGGHDDRWDGYSRRDDRRDSRRDDRRDDRTRHSNSATPGTDARPSSRASNLSRDNRQDKPQRAEEKPKLDEEAKKAARLARVQAWKKQKEEDEKNKGSPAAASSPAAVTPATPTVASADAGETTRESTQTNNSSQSVAEKKLKQVKTKEPFKLAADAVPSHLKTAVKLNGVTPPGAPVASTYKLPVPDLVLTSTDRSALASAKPNGNVASFGPKAKLGEAGTETIKKKSLLDNDDNTGKRSLQALPDFTPLDENVPDATTVSDGEMSDIGSPEGNQEEIQAQIQAQLEKRREIIAQEEDTRMEDAPVVVEEATTKMDVDDTADAEEDDVDPLDAFMAGLSDPQPSSGRPQGEAFYDDHEPDLTAVEGEDLLALAASKKKKKEVPVVDHKKIEYPPFRKNFYTEPMELSQMTPEEVEILRTELDNVKVKGKNVPRPVRKWAQMGLLQSTMDVFAKLRYEKPTPIQSQAIPMAESGLDFIGVAKTGSGKTLAFGIPMIRHILDQPPLKSADGPIGLILAPTRELAVQISAELKPFLKASGLHIASAYGGQPISEQIAMVKRGNIHVLVATPGRLIDLLQSNSGRVLNLRRVTYLILDEADRMFDMGFEPQVLRISDNIRPDRQTILFSATMPKNINALAKRGLKDPAEVIIGGRSIVADTVTQVVKLVQPKYEAKISELLRSLGQLFAENEDAQILIFVERQETAEDLLSKLYKARYTMVNTIHGAKDQNDRSEAIQDFRQGVLPMLIATSVAARGLDVPNLNMVFNFDCPTHLEDYVHRCGRTGRAGNRGTAITLIENPGEDRYAFHVVKALKESNQPVPEDLEQVAAGFKAKLDSGEEKWHTHGFGGKGLDKLDAARALEKRREKRAHKIEGEDDSEEEEELPAIKQPEVASSAGASTPAAASKDTSLLSQLLQNKFVVNKTERPEPNTNKAMSAKERAMAVAARVDGRLSKKGAIHHGQPIDNKGPDAGAFHSTIEVNDFPQKARWAVTNRTNVSKILDSTGVSITTKGIYYPPGKEPGEGEEPKLSILVEGDTENIVTTAMLELTRLLREATTMSEEVGPRGATGRYSVV